MAARPALIPPSRRIGDAVRMELPVPTVAKGEERRNKSMNSMGGFMTTQTDRFGAAAPDVGCCMCLRHRRMARTRTSSTGWTLFVGPIGQKKGWDSASIR